MTGDHCIIITAAYEPQHAYGRSLGCIAPELGDALTMIDHRADERSVSRTWAGIVDRPTFGRFAAAWRLADHSGTPTPAGEIRTFDGMNWESDDASPIIYVTVEVTPRVTVDSENTPMPPVIRARDCGTKHAISPPPPRNQPGKNGRAAGPDTFSRPISSAPDSGPANAPPPSQRGYAFVPNRWLG